MANKKDVAPSSPRRRFPRVQTDVGGPSMTQQSFKKECDINQIIAKHEKNGTLSEFLMASRQERPGTYGDFSDSVAYDEALNMVSAANQRFDALPARLRERFSNSPSEFLKFINNPKNADEAVELGILKKSQAEPASEPDAKDKKNKSVPNTET